MAQAGVFGKPKIDLGALRKQKDKTVKRLVVGLDQMAKARKVKTLEGHAAFNSNTELTVKTAKEIINVTFGTNKKNSIVFNFHKTRIENKEIQMLG